MWVSIFLWPHNNAFLAIARHCQPAACYWLALRFSFYFPMPSLFTSFLFICLTYLFFFFPHLQCIGFILLIIPFSPPSLLTSLYLLLFLTCYFCLIIFVCAPCFRFFLSLSLAFLLDIFSSHLLFANRILLSISLSFPSSLSSFFLFYIQLYDNYYFNIFKVIKRSI